MLRTRGGGSHVIQAIAPPFGVTLAGLFATLHRWNALATLPRSGNAPGVLPTFSAQVRTRTGRIKSVLPTLTAPFYCDLVIHPYGSRALKGRRKMEWIPRSRAGFRRPSRAWINSSGFPGFRCAAVAAPLHPGLQSVVPPGRNPYPQRLSEFRDRN